MDPSSPSFGTKEGSCGYGLIPKEQVGRGNKGRRCNSPGALLHALQARPTLDRLGWPPMASARARGVSMPNRVPTSPVPSCHTPTLQYPYFSTAALSPQNSFYTSDPLHGCGQCFQVMCADSRSGGVCGDATAARGLLAFA